MNGIAIKPSSAQELASAGLETIRSYEDSATAIGRLDAAARLSPLGLRALLAVRCIAVASGTSRGAMIALMQANDGAGSASLQERLARAFREGAARARGGALPSAGSLRALLGGVQPADTAPELDALLGDRDERTPPVLKAALAASLLCATLESGAPSSEFDQAHLTSLAVTFVLCVGGATTDAWITLPRRAATASADGAGPPLRDTFSALARDARAAERGLEVAHELCDADDARVRAALGRAAYSALDLLALLRERIVVTIPDAARTLALTPPTAGAAVARLVELGIAREVTGKARSRAFVYDGIIGALAPPAAT